MNAQVAANREKEIVKVSLKGILVNVVLVVFKAFVGIIAGSGSIIMDAVNNFTDALSSIITIIGTKLSAKRADKKHPYGYGRIEYMTSTLIAVLIFSATRIVVLSATTRIFLGKALALSISPVSAIIPLPIRISPTAHS